MPGRLPLLDGVTQKDYDALIKDYFKWSKKHDVEVTFIRQVPLFGHATARNPNPYDFVEFLASDHVTSGRGGGFQAKCRLSV